jgi:hypothetical protein
MENHHFQWENPLFLWPFSIAMLVHQRVNMAGKSTRIGVLMGKSWKIRRNLIDDFPMNSNVHLVWGLISQLATAMNTGGYGP